MYTNQFSLPINIPDGFIVFISGVPGVGKTTLSYELLNSFDQFRLIQETDLMREIIRGYNNYLDAEIVSISKNRNDTFDISDHSKFMNYEEACTQCKHMKHSLFKIVKRQQRKGISTIINGVHIIPEVLKELAAFKNIIFINLYISDEQEFIKRFDNRCEKKYSINNIEYIFNSNLLLHQKTSHLQNNCNAYHSFDVG